MLEFETGSLTDGQKWAPTFLQMPVAVSLNPDSSLCFWKLIQSSVPEVVHSALSALGAQQIHPSKFDSQYLLTIFIAVFIAFVTNCFASRIFSNHWYFN